MLLRIFSGNRPGNIVIIFLFSLLLWIPDFLTPETRAFYYPVPPMPLYALLAGGIEGMVLVSKILSFLFVLFMSIMMIRLNSRFILIQERTFLPAFFFLTITGFYSGINEFSGYLFGGLALIFVIDALLSSYKTEPNSYRYFEAGLLIGIASLFYVRILYFLPLVWIASIILRPFFWREWIFPVLGAAVPYFVWASLRFLTDRDPWDMFTVIYRNLINFTFNYIFDWQNLVVPAYILFLVMIASVYMLRVFQFRRVYIRNYYLVFFWLFILTIISFLFFSRYDPGFLYVFAIPVSYILSNYFVNSRKTLPNHLMFSAYVLLMLLNTVNRIFDLV